MDISVEAMEGPEWPECFVIQMSVCMSESQREKGGYFEVAFISRPIQSVP